MRDIIRVATFLGYVAFGLAAAWRARTGRREAARVAVNLFLIYTLAVSFGAGLIQVDLWPFSTWPLVAGIHPPVAVHDRLVVIDRDGRERDVDYRAWQPFVVEELLGWVDGRMMKLEPADRDRAAAYLVSLAERGAAQGAQGARVGSVRRTWGPLTATTFLLHPKLWDDRSAVPSLPLTGLRFYREQWNLDARLRDPSDVERVLMYEYRRP